MMGAIIDLSRVPPPAAIEEISFDAQLDLAIARFLYEWEQLRLTRPTLPTYNVQSLKSDPAHVVLRAHAYVRTLDRARVNDAIRAVLALTAKDSDLDNICAMINVQRLVIVPATESSPAIMESDARLLERYLLAWSRAAAGSRQRYLFETLTAWPQCHHAAVIGRGVHGRRGDVDLVVAGPGGRDATDAELTIVRGAAGADDVVPEATDFNLLRATRRLWSAHYIIVVSTGPDETVVRQEGDKRVRAAGAERMKIGGEIHPLQIGGAAYGPSVIEVLSPTAAPTLPPDPYGIPVLDQLTIETQRRSA